MGARAGGVDKVEGTNIERPRIWEQAMFRREALKRRALIVFVDWRIRKCVSVSGERVLGCRDLKICQK